MAQIDQTKEEKAQEFWERILERKEQEEKLGEAELANIALLVKPLREVAWKMMQEYYLTDCIVADEVKGCLQYMVTMLNGRDVSEEDTEFRSEILGVLLDSKPDEARLFSLMNHAQGDDEELLLWKHLQKLHLGDGSLGDLCNWRGNPKIKVDAEKALKERGFSQDQIYNYIFERRVRKEKENLKRAGKDYLSPELKEIYDQILELRGL